ncbi:MULTISPECIES: ABC-2 transporter permease [unclassified Planococcus (in: firmicutes)]|uniref:ABC-2 transporter permease n=1 Tax=unclassified Planococcus (in: firmicutes) TaxID=2662419 RepID=UPI000C330911|nr:MULTISPECIES: ABC-2 transporter permease [unclassified Planococcus (in: firmicutes)]AUD15069.1 ABC-2 transporter permease [Planococcus sp. MB-3u-03]PKG46991.1 ABC-2 transporter permease [Planococcus sp. Urea-trap-24]PKG87880.1 ABC-2 transporter permease [Planococcus sp. Urea-3u-39]PKH39107.1 ABC-2 transporter permease [Planococcus sp. MB-3u-09]
MFNLIRRDVILQKRQLLLFIPAILFFIIMGAPPILTILVASIFIPFNTYAYDEKVETNILLNSLPYTRREIIASRYLGAIVYMVLAIGITSLALFVFNTPFTLTDISIGSGLFLLFAALTFPLFQILKPGYITTVILATFILLTFLARPIGLFIAEHLTGMIDFIVNLSVTTLYTWATLIIVGLYLTSWGITTLIYQRKAF